MMCSFRLWLVVSMLHTVVSVVKRASRGLEPRRLPVWLGGSNLVHLHCVLHRHLEHVLNVAVLDQRLQVARRVDGRGPSGLSDQLRAGLAAVFQVDPVITSVDLLIAQVAVTRRIGDNGLTVSINPVADSNVVTVLSVALYLRQRLSDIVIVELITDFVSVGLAIPEDLPPEDKVALKCDLPTVRAGGSHAYFKVVVVYPVVVA